jgi:hypothetical protein
MMRFTGYGRGECFGENLRSSGRSPSAHAARTGIEFDPSAIVRQDAGSRLTCRWLLDHAQIKRKSMSVKAFGGNSRKQFRFIILGFQLLHDVPPFLIYCLEVD